MKLVSHMRNSSLRRAAGVGTVVGIISRVVALTFANYYLIIVLSAVFTSYSRLASSDMSPRTSSRWG